MVNSLIVVALLGMLGVAVTAAGTYLLGRRRSSGRVETSDAATLWAASEQMRKELRDELVAARGQVVELIRQNETLHQQCTDLLGEIDRLTRRLATVEGTSHG